MKNLLCSALGAALAVANTVAATTASFDANYDNLAAPEVGQGAPVGTYDALTYNSFQVLTNSLDLVGGFVPHSEPIFIGPDSQSTNGTPNITVTPPFKTLSPKSFWFGCDAATGQGAVDAATQCTIVVTAFKKASDQEVAVASFDFTPPVDLSTKVPMVQAVLPDAFEDVYTVVIVQDNPSVINLGIDDFEYTVST